MHKEGRGGERDERSGSDGRGGGYGQDTGGKRKKKWRAKGELREEEWRK